MIKIKNKSNEEIAKIGRKIGESFADEKAGIVSMVTREQAIRAFEIMTDYYYRAGVLYATSERGEGYLAYWGKKTKPAMGPVLHMVWRFLCELTPKAWMAVAGSGGEQYAKIFRKEPDYIVVSMVVVLREFQGKGFMHKVLEQPFAEAASKGIPCVLDTDTPLKVKKYIRCGMELCGEKKLKHGISLYTMAYRKTPTVAEVGKEPFPDLLLRHKPDMLVKRFQEASGWKSGFFDIFLRLSGREALTVPQRSCILRSLH